MLTDSLARMIVELAQVTGLETFHITAALAIVLVSLICGGVGSLVVGNRMAFFSDALGHCALAGVSLGILITLGMRLAADHPFHDWLEPLVMVAFGAAVGVGIAFVRERTSLASDTVIGVFFAGAIGFGSLMYAALSRRSNKDPEMFLFGSPISITEGDLLRLMLLAVVMAVVLMLRYNQFVFASFNPSLARSRRIPVRTHNYLFIVLLALVVNLSLKAVGIMLINAMLIVPAATASVLSRNMRQMFWWTIGLSLSAGLGGLLLSSTVDLPLGGDPLPLGTSASIVVLSVTGFFLAMVVSPWIKGKQPV